MEANNGYSQPDRGVGGVEGGGKWPKEAKDHKNSELAGPVKAACLSCRQKKAKCDGVKPVCGQCNRKQLECIYIKSKRGGARKKRNPEAPSALSEFLKKLDGLLVPQFELQHAEPEPTPTDDPTNIVRVFTSREEIFRCYYNEVHPFLSVMPPRHYLVDVLPTLLPESPFLLAAQTVMTLAPHALDPNPSSRQSRRMRSAASTALSRKAMEVIQAQIAAGTPTIETVQALVILAVWEWGTTNDAATSMERSRQAAQIAMDMGLHDMDANGTGFSLEGIDWRKDMMRRTWWTLYVYQLTSALVSGIMPPLPADDPRIKVDFPVCSDKDRTWSTWINCIRQCFRIVNMINVLAAAEGGDTDHGMKSWGGAGGDSNLSSEQQEHKRRQMVSIDRQIMGLMQETEKMSKVEQVPGGEEDVVRNQQIATRFGLAVIHIHLHRQVAFPEVSLFSRRICGLRSSTDDDSGGEESMLGSASTPQSVPQSLQGSQQNLFALAAQPPEPYQLGQMPTIPGAWPELQNLENTYGSFEASFDNQNQDMFQVNQMMNNLGGAQAQAPAQMNFNGPANGVGVGVNDSPIGSGGSNGLPHLSNSHTASESPNGVGDMRSSPAGIQSPSAPGDNAPVAPINPEFAANWHYNLQNESITDDMWQPDAFPSYLPTPWFAQNGGAAALYVKPEDETKHYPALELGGGGGDGGMTESNPNPFLDVHGSYQSNIMSAPLQPPQFSSNPPVPVSKPAASVADSSTSNSTKRHKAWGVDEDGKIAPTEDVKAAEALETFPPGISLARCATAAHTIVRLEVLHRSAALALDGTPKWIPFCSCGLVSGAYAFLLLVLAVQAENTFGTYSEARNEEVEALLTNVKIILGGLEAYGTMWEGIDMMAREVRAAVEAATQLPIDVQSQVSGRSSQSPARLQNTQSPAGFQNTLI